MKIVRAKYQGEIFYGEFHEGEVLRYEGFLDFLHDKLRWRKVNEFFER